MEDEELNEEQTQEDTNVEVSKEQAEDNTDYKSLLDEALLENAKLKQDIETLRNDLDEAHRAFMGTPRQSEDDKKTYSSIKGDIM